jgi:hypothetical protein
MDEEEAHTNLKLYKLWNAVNFSSNSCGFVLIKGSASQYKDEQVVFGAADQPKIEVTAIMPRDANDHFEGNDASSKLPSHVEPIAMLRELLRAIGTQPAPGFSDPGHGGADQAPPDADEGHKFMRAYHAISSSEDRQALLRLAETLASFNKK